MANINSTWYYVCLLLYVDKNSMEIISDKIVLDMLDPLLQLKE